MTGDVVTDARVRPGARLRRSLRGGRAGRSAARKSSPRSRRKTSGRKLAIVLDNTVYSAPVIRERIPGGHVQITGRFSLRRGARTRDRAASRARCRRRSKSRRSAPSARRSAAIRFAQGEMSFIVGAVCRADLHGGVLQRRGHCSPTSVCR